MFIAIIVVVIVIIIIIVIITIIILSGNWPSCSRSSTTTGRGWRTASFSRWKSLVFFRLKLENWTRLRDYEMRGETRLVMRVYRGRECPCPCTGPTTATATATVTASATTRRGPFKQHIQHIQIERTMLITIMPLIMWDNKTKRAPVIQTVAIERMCHQIAVGCVLTETRLNSTEWPNGPQAATATATAATTSAAAFCL